MIDYKPAIDYDLNIEKSVIAILLGDVNAFASVYGVLEPDCFHSTDMKTIYTAMNTIWHDGKMVEAFTVNAQIVSTGVTMMEGEAILSYLMTLMFTNPNRALLMQWSLALREMYARRLMKQLTSTPIGNNDVFEEAGKLQDKIRRVLDVRITNNWQTTGHAAKQFLDTRQRNLSGEIGISTTFKTLDQVNGGFRKGWLIIIGARSSVGKSAIAGQIGLGTAAEGKPVGLMSLEMPAADLFGRLVAQHSGIPFSALDRKVLSSDREVQFNNSLDALNKMPLYFAENLDVNVHDIRTAAQNLQQKHGIELLIVDYLQLIRASTKGNVNREQAVADISRNLKALAMELNIPVIALAQLNKDGDKRADKRPTKSDMRESSGIENDADVIMLLHRDWVVGITKNAQGNSTEHEADLIIAKWRNGKTCEIKLEFESSQMRFKEKTDPIPFKPVPASYIPYSEAEKKFGNDEDAPF